MMRLLIHLLGLFPLINLIFSYVADQLGADPIDAFIDESGLWSLRFLLLTLTVTPVMMLTCWQPPLNIRQILGLYAFFYSCLHFLSYLWFEQNFELIEIIKDTLTRPPIAIGVFSFLLMLPLAITSNAKIKQRLEPQCWKRLHQLIYFVTLGSLTHFWWLAKTDVWAPYFYTVIFILLLVFRFLPVKDKRTT